MFISATSVVDTIKVLQTCSTALAVPEQDMATLTRENMLGVVMADLEKQNKLFAVLYQELKLGYGTAFMISRVVNTLIAKGLQHKG